MKKEKILTVEKILSPENTKRRPRTKNRNPQEELFTVKAICTQSATKKMQA